MSAPSMEKATEQPTQPLPIAGTEHLPGGGNWLMSGPSVLLVFPGVPVAAFLVGEFVLRPYLLVDETARSNFAILALVAVLAVVYAAYAAPRILGRGKDGRS